MGLEDSDGAERRTSLAGERTLLAWWRTGLTTIAVALGVGRLLPELAPDTIRWPHAILGVAFAVYGIARFVLGQRRWIDFERGLGAHPGRSADRLLVVFTGAGVILGLGAPVVIVAQ